MADHSVRKSPLANVGQSGIPMLRFQGAAVREQPFKCYFNFRLESAAIARFAELFGHELPVEPNTVSCHKDATVMWVRSDEWMLIEKDERHPHIVEKLNALCADSFSTWTDQSSAFTSLSVRGENSIDLLSRGLVFDLHPRNFKPGRCVQTLISRTRVAIVNRTAEDGAEFELIVRRSYSDYLWNWLEDKGQEAEFSNSHFG